MLSPNDLSALIIKMSVLAHLSILAARPNGESRGICELKIEGVANHITASPRDLLRFCLLCLSEFFQSGHGTCRVIFTLSGLRASVAFGGGIVF